MRSLFDAVVISVPTLEKVRLPFIVIDETLPFIVVAIPDLPMIIANAFVVPIDMLPAVPEAPGAPVSIVISPLLFNAPDTSPVFIVRAPELPDVNPPAPVVIVIAPPTPVAPP